jgi:phosphate transport system substrate-binding protein
VFSEYNKINGLKVNYQSIGSGGGILQLTNKTVDFGASDAPMNGKQDSGISAPVIHIPVTAGAVVLGYNLPDVKDTLKLSPDVLADIFLGTITKWNDPKITALNKGVKLPATAILIAHRSDGSGTTNIFTTYLAKVSKDWNTKVGKGSAVNWPAGLGGKGNEGVSGLVKQTPGAIGYIELAYAVQNNMAFAKMQNKTGNFITPSIASVTAAANITIPPDSKVSHDQYRCCRWLPHLRLLLGADLQRAEIQQPFFGPGYQAAETALLDHPRRSAIQRSAELCTVVPGRRQRR